MDQFIYKASHDLKGPLISICGLTNLALNENQEKNIKEYLRLINKTALRLSQTLSGLLKLATCESPENDIKEIQIRSRIEQIISELGSFQVKDIKISVEIPEQITLCSNEAIFNSVLQNLVENAIKYSSSDRESEIKISASKNLSSVTIKVKDNGIGIAEELKDKVFEMFFRANEAVSGSGLGLYIVKTYLEKNWRINLLRIQYQSRL